MTQAATQSLLETPFEVELISEAPAPAGADGVWHQYVIAQGANRITGLRCGTRSEVDRLVREMVGRLNERYGKQVAKAAR